MLILIIFFLAIALLVVTAKYFLLRREVCRISDTIQRIQKNKTPTNERLSVELQQKPVIDLANSINIIYEDIYQERGQHIRTMDEIRQNMAGISHDLRTPLTSIIGYTKLIQRAENTNEQNCRFLSIIYSKAQYLNRMISNLFDLTRLENGAYSFELSNIDLGEILSEELAGFYDVLTENGREPDIILAEQPLFVMGDNNAYARIFSNLLQNMLHHGAEEIKIHSRHLGDTIEIIFSNRAHDLTEKDIDKLFQRFYTADTMRTKENTGLGLALVKELAEQMNSRISVDLTGDILTFTLICKAAVYK